MRLAELYDRNAGYWDSRLYRTAYYGAYHRLFRKLQRQRTLGRPARVLDCGIGAGLLSQAFLDVAGWPVEIYGIDLSPKLLAMSATKFHNRAVAARLILADIRHLPFRDEQMDLVLSGLVLEHVSNPVDAVREMGRVLRRGQSLVLTATRRGAPDHYFRWKYGYKPYRRTAFFDWLRSAGLTEIRAYSLPGIARFFAQAYLGVKA